MAQIRIFDIKEEIHRKLKAQAALKGLSLNDYIKKLLEKEAKNNGWSLETT